MTNELGHAMYINMCSLYMLPDNMQKKKTQKTPKHKTPPKSKQRQQKTYKEVPYLES